MSDLIKHGTADNFAELTASGKKVVDFWATWCGPCRMQGSILDAVAPELPEGALIKVDVDANPELAAKYSVRSIPTVVYLNDGEVVEQAVGVQDKEKLVSFFQ